MKKIISFLIPLALIAMVLTGCSGNDSDIQNNDLSGTVKTGGSTSVERLMTALIYKFQNENKEITVNYEMNGSSDGIKNTLSGMYEIGHASRELKTDGSEDGVKAIAYAIDGIAIILHHDNPIDNLSEEQVRKIYSGEIRRWSEIGGKDELISLVTREASSGTKSAFCEIVGLEADESTKISKDATVCDSTGAVQTIVSQNKNAIGYMSFSDVNEEKVKMVKYDGVAVVDETLIDGTYKLKRDFLMVVREGETLSNGAQAFIDFVQSDMGRQVILENSLLPLN